MPQEIEIKLALTDPARLRARLGDVGAVCLGRVFEDNQLFDTDERRLRGAGVGLRLRRSGPEPLDSAGPGAGVATLTYKGPLTGGVIRQREELETAVGDASAVEQILRQLGFQPFVRYEKRRETWRLGESEISIDELPRLGWFVEIESPSVAAVEQTRQMLALDAAPAVAETYVHMAVSRGVATSFGGRELCFEGRSAG